MIKLLFFTFIFLTSCEKKETICGQVYAIPDPVYQTDTTLFYVCARINNGNFVWIERTRSQYDSVKVGDWVCENK